MESSRFSAKRDRELFQGRLEGLEQSHPQPWLALGLLWPSVRKERSICNPCRRRCRIVRYFGTEFCWMDVARCSRGRKPVDLCWTQLAEPGPEAISARPEQLRSCSRIRVECNFEHRASGWLPDAICWRRKLQWYRRCSGSASRQRIYSDLPGR